MQYTITREQFNAHAKAHRDDPESMFWDDLGHVFWDDDDDPFDQMTTNLIWMGTAYHFVMTENSVSFTNDGLKAAYSICEAVFNDYNEENGRSTKDPDSPWVIYDLGGDDSVDECGSLPMIAMDMLSEVAGIP